MPTGLLSAKVLSSLSLKSSMPGNKSSVNIYRFIYFVMWFRVPSLNVNTLSKLHSFSLVGGYVEA